MPLNADDNSPFFLEVLPNVSASEGFQQTLVVDPKLSRQAVLAREYTALRYYQATKGLGFVDPRYAAAYMETGYNPKLPPVSYVPVPNPPYYPTIIPTLTCGETASAKFVNGGQGAPPPDPFVLNTNGTAAGFIIDLSAIPGGESAYIVMGNYPDLATDMYVGLPGAWNSPRTADNFDTTPIHYTLVPPSSIPWPSFSTATVTKVLSPAEIAAYPQSLVPVVVYHRGTFPISYVSVMLQCM